MNKALIVFLITTSLFSDVVCTSSNGRFVRRAKRKLLNTKQILSSTEVRDLFQLWNDALLTLDADEVTQRYAKEGTLLPTVSDIPRDTPELINDYFQKFLLQKPSGTILSGTVQVGKNWATDGGIYEFAFGATGTIVQARYTFFYVYEDGGWKILHHHSSQMQEDAVMNQNITVWDVRNLFHLWNNALSSLDSEKVVARYADDAVLLPTVSDTPRTSPELLKEYFDEFLKNKPTGVILNSYVHIGSNYALDNGVYEITMQASGKVVKARYSFVYMFEDGHWKIRHHHSSTMPEERSKAPEVITQNGVRSLFTRWNDAMIESDKRKVSALYLDKAVLIASDKDKYVYSRSQIEDYYEDYLQGKPQCKVISGDILIGYNWAQDVGICECTFANNATDINRYSLSYNYTDGDWKITNRHDSVLPEL